MFAPSTPKGLGRRGTCRTLPCAPSHASLFLVRHGKPQATLGRPGAYPAAVPSGLASLGVHSGVQTGFRTLTRSVCGWLRWPWHPRRRLLRQTPASASLFLTAAHLSSVRYLPYLSNQRNRKEIAITPGAIGGAYTRRNVHDQPAFWRMSIGNLES